jgi:hypothetical protein
MLCRVTKFTKSLLVEHESATLQNPLLDTILNHPHYILTTHFLNTHPKVILSFPPVFK